MRHHAQVHTVTLMDMCKYGEACSTGLTTPSVLGRSGASGLELRMSLCTSLPLRSVGAITRPMHGESKEVWEGLLRDAQ